MKRSSLWTLFAGSSLALVLALAGGCGKASSSPALGGETHWLQQCGDGASCGPGLECLCGVCSAACTEDASCAELDPNAACAARDGTIYAAACGSGAPERLCVQRDTDVGLAGRPYDPRGCFDDLQLAGLPSETDAPLCEPIETHARDANGGCWLFPGSCLPEGFLPLSFLDNEECATVTDLCPIGFPCDASHFWTIAGCLTCEEAPLALADRWRTIVSSYNLCNTDADCILESQPSCGDQCAAPINRYLTDAFNRDLFRLNRGFCTMSDWAEKCGGNSSSCDASPPRCRQGVCVSGADLP